MNMRMDLMKFSVPLASTIRILLLEKARAMRDSGQMPRAQLLVNMANELKERTKAIEEDSRLQRSGWQEVTTGTQCP